MEIDGISVSVWRSPASADHPATFPPDHLAWTLRLSATGEDRPIKTKNARRGAKGRASCQGKLILSMLIEQLRKRDRNETQT